MNLQILYMNHKETEKEVCLASVLKNKNQYWIKNRNMLKYLFATILDSMEWNVFRLLKYKYHHCKASLWNQQPRSNLHGIVYACLFIAGNRAAYVYKQLR